MRPTITKSAWCKLCFDFYMIEAKPENLIGDRAYDNVAATVKARVAKSIAERCGRLLNRRRATIIQAPWDFAPVPGSI